MDVVFPAMLCLPWLATFQNKKRKERDKKEEKQGKKRKNKIIHISPLLLPACSIPFRIFSKAKLTTPVTRLFNKRVVTFSKGSFSRNSVGPKEARSQLHGTAYHSYSCKGSVRLLSFSLGQFYGFWETKDHHPIDSWSVIHPLLQDIYIILPLAGSAETVMGAAICGAPGTKKSGGTTARVSIDWHHK